MKGKLIKTEVNYLLKNEEGVVIAATSLKKEGLALSLKNCQAIANGYDLDELAENEVRYMRRGDERLQRWYGFVDGFEKALEILGDKKFSEKDLLHIWNYSNLYYQGEKEYTFLNAIQSLQQTEWDVEIVTTTRMENGKSGLDVPVEKPKLDADGCLILKRKI